MASAFLARVKGKLERRWGYSLRVGEDLIRNRRLCFLGESQIRGDTGQEWGEGSKCGSKVYSGSSGLS